MITQGLHHGSINVVSEHYARQPLDAALSRFHLASRIAMSSGARTKMIIHRADSPLHTDRSSMRYATIH